MKRGLIVLVVVLLLFILLSSQVNALNVTLNEPADAFNASITSLTFNCSAVNFELVNLSIFIWNSTGLFYSNTVNISGTNNSSQWQINLTENSYNWSCLAYSTNQSAWALNRTLTVDTTAPIINVISPTTTFVRDTIWINATVTDLLSGIKSTGYSITNSTYFVSGTLNASFNTTILKDGSYIINYTALDWASNSNSTTRNVTVDNTAPSVNMKSSASTIKEDETVNLECKASDANGIKNITISYDGRTIKSCSSSPCKKENYRPPWTGTEKIICIVYDNALNLATNSVSLKVEKKEVPKDVAVKEEEKIYDITANLERNRKETRRLGKGEGVKFKVKGRIHTIVVDRIYSDSVRLKISSSTFYAIIEMNKVKHIDLDGDKFSDIAITLLGVANNKANLIFELLERLAPAIQNITNVSNATNVTNITPAAPITNVTCGNNVCEESENCSSCPQDCKCKENEKCIDGKCVPRMLWKLYLWIAIIIIAVIAFLAWLFKEKYIIIKFGKKRLIRRKY